LYLLNSQLNQATGAEITIVGSRRPRWVPLIFCVALLSTMTVARIASAAEPPSRVLAETNQGEGVEPTADVPTSQKLFEFRSGFWINLHHYLLLQAVTATPGARKGRAESTAQAALPLPAMSPAQKATWENAVHFYLRFGNRDPLRDKELIQANYELSDAGNSPSIKSRRLSPDLASTLEETAPVYRALWRQGHDRRNRTWAAAAAKLVVRYGPAMSQRIAAAFQTQWPAEPIPAEVVLYANWAGAYTTTHSTLITISSADPSGQDFTPLETLFHEASHGLVDNLAGKLDSDLRAVGKPPRFDVIHVIIFYTAGIVTLDAIGNNAVGYVPLAQKYGLYDRVANWKHYREVCEKDWRPYLDGKTTFDAGLIQIARDL
jgi:hypothetical protein